MLNNVKVWGVHFTQSNADHSSFVWGFKTERGKLIIVHFR